MRLLNKVLSGRRKHKKIPQEEKKNTPHPLLFTHIWQSVNYYHPAFTLSIIMQHYTQSRGNFKQIIGTAAPCWFFFFVLFLLPVHLIYHRTGSWQQTLLSPGGGGEENTEH